MECGQKPHTEKQKVITNDCIYDVSCKLTSHTVSDLENCERLILLHSVRIRIILCKSVSVMKCKFISLSFSFLFKWLSHFIL
jgi:hypothetical protein